MKRFVKTFLAVILTVVCCLGTIAFSGCAKTKKDLFAVCKVHYEPLGIYYGTAENGTAVTDGTTFAICDDESNAIRAFKLLAIKGIEIKNNKDALPYNADETELVFNTDTWTTKNGVKIKLIAENLLVQALGDYSFVLLPCNTAYTGKIAVSRRADVENDINQVTTAANIIAARKSTYEKDAEYKAKIDALANAMLSEEVSNFFAEKYYGAMTCDNTTQIDLRTNKDETVKGFKADGSLTVITVCASDVPHAEVLEGVVKGILATQGYELKVTILDWTIQNDAVNNKDYDANYFQHVPYLESYLGK